MPLRVAAERDLASNGVPLPCTCRTEPGTAEPGWGLKPPPPPLFTTMTVYFVLVWGKNEQIKKKEKNEKSLVYYRFAKNLQSYNLVPNV